MKPVKKKQQTNKQTNKLKLVESKLGEKERQTVNGLISLDVSKREVKLKDNKFHQLVISSRELCQSVRVRLGRFILVAR